MPRVAEQIADWLADHGVEQVFAVTGGGAMFLNHALGGHPRLKCTFMHHEQACAMAAEGYARIAGKPAVVMLTTGPGAINAFNGVFGAYTDSIPMIVISGQIKRETCMSFHHVPGMRQLGDQEAPTVEMARPISKFAALIRTEEEIGEILPRAFTAATTGRPGPVWIDIPLDIQQSQVSLQFEPLSTESKPDFEGLQQAIKIIADRLIVSHRPVLLGGTGVRLSGMVRRLRDLVERYQLPLATAWTHDLIPTQHPLFIGRPGTIGTRPGNFCVQASDFLLVLGSRLNIRQTSYNWQAFAKNAWVAQVDVDAAELRKPTVSVDFPVEADLKVFLPLLERELEQRALPDFQPWINWCREIAAKYSPIDEHQQDIGDPINPYLAVSRVFDTLREADVIVCGNASACIIPFQVGTIHGSQRLFSNSGSASMGYDLPAALGASLALSEAGAQVICFAGDGSLQMNIQELQTLKTLNANVKIVVLNNRGYLSISQTHENFFGKVIGASPESGVEFPDFVAVAKAYGIRAIAIRSVAELESLQVHLAASGPMLIDIHVNPRQEFAPRIKSRVDAEGRFVTPELDDMFPFLNSEELIHVRQSAESLRTQ